MKFAGRLILLLAGLMLAWPLAAQYRDDQFKRDAFTQTYADTTEKTAADTSAIFSFKEFFGGLAGKNKASLKTLTMGSAVFVGANQIYNRQYWKLPIVYGGIGAGIYGGIHFNKLYQSTEDSRYNTYSTLSFVGAGLFYWGSLMDGAIMFDRGGKYPNAAKDNQGRLLCGAGVGITANVLERVDALRKAKVDVIVLDSSHGHSENVLRCLRMIKDAFPDYEPIIVADIDITD